jgi:transposase-like protein
MKKQRRKHTAEFKARVALEAIRGVKTLSEIAQKFEIHPVMVGNWKKEMLEHLPELFEKKRARTDKEIEREKAQLHQKVGQLSMEVDFLEKKCKQLGIPVKGRNS